MSAYSRLSGRSFGSRSARGAFTLVEVLVVVAVSGVVLASLTVAFQQRVRFLQVESSARLAAFLADERMQEVRAKPFRDPQTLAMDTRDSGETNRSRFDNVGDYSGWLASPPVDLRGAVMSNYAGLTECVSVTNVWPSAPGTDVGVFTGFKRITVMVSNADVRVSRVSVVGEFD